jgi:hypothetical protein
MNNDKELLTLAAKAAGIEGRWLENEFWSGIQGVFIGNADVRFWNPLTDDEDALRLAVKLEIEPRQAPNMASALFPVESPIRFAVCNENHGDDPYAATRRAIVRAAAEIGRGMG